MIYGVEETLQITAKCDIDNSAELNGWNGHFWQKHHL